jgi:hypothetical protein
MKELNNWHPYPRYGVAAAMLAAHVDEIDLEDIAQVKELLRQALNDGLTRFIIMRKEVPPKDYEGKISYTYLSDPKRLDPGSKSGQNSANGYYAAPHVLAPNNSAGLVKEAKALLKALDKPKFDPAAPYELKRSFAPLVAKVNNGNPNMTNPKVGVLMAGFTAVATLTSFKPATYTALKGGGDANNVGVIPDLPFYNEASGSYPLRDFIDLFRRLSTTKQAADLMEGRFDKKFIRPRIFQGNYPNAPRGRSIGAVSLMVAMGEWIKEATELAKDERAQRVRAVLKAMVGRPIYLISNAGAKQETFRHHLVDLTTQGEMKDIVIAINRTHLIGEESKERGESNKTLQFRMMADRFLRLFTAPSFQDFLAFRAEYPSTLLPLINLYYEKMNLTPELIQSARAYGQSLNYAAYKAADRELKDDLKQSRKGVNLQEYKDKFLTQFESTIGSAKTGPDLISRLSTIAGRITKQEIKPEAIPFMEAVALGKDAGGIDTDTAKQLITAFMRVSTYDSSKANKEKEEATATPVLDGSTADDERPD